MAMVWLVSNPPYNLYILQKRRNALQEKCISSFIIVLIKLSLRRLNRWLYGTMQMMLS